jgi:hypothetical protein
MILDYRLLFPTGTAQAHLINSFHTPHGAIMAKYDVSFFLLLQIGLLKIAFFVFGFTNLIFMFNPGFKSPPYSNFFLVVFLGLHSHGYMHQEKIVDFQAFRYLDYSYIRRGMEYVF